MTTSTTGSLLYMDTGQLPRTRQSQRTHFLFPTSSSSLVGLFITTAPSSSGSHLGVGVFPTPNMPPVPGSLNALALEGRRPGAVKNEVVGTADMSELARFEAFEEEEMGFETFLRKMQPEM